MEATETRADGSEVATFSNFDGDVMLSDTSDGSGSDDAPHWVTYNQYDQYANVLESAQPSAVDTDSVSTVNGRRSPATTRRRRTSTCAFTRPAA